MNTKMLFHRWAALACATSFVSLAFMVATSTIRAELPPDVYAELKAKSPEILTIRTQEVTTAGAAISVTAKVTSVERSGSGVKQGDTIEIGYHSVKQTAPGPSEAAILEKGKSYRAYLSKNENGGDYGLAARGHSFEAAGSELPQWRGQYEGGPEFSKQVIKTRDGWSRFWALMQQPAPQALDETREMAISISVGERPTGGFIPKVLSATERDGKYVIFYTDGPPSPDTFVTQVITHPWCIAIVPKSDLPVETKKQE